MLLTSIRETRHETSGGITTIDIKLDKKNNETCVKLVEGKSTTVQRWIDIVMKKIASLASQEDETLIGGTTTSATC